MQEVERLQKTQILESRVRLSLWCAHLPGSRWVPLQSDQPRAAPANSADPDMVVLWGFFPASGAYVYIFIDPHSRWIPCSSPTAEHVSRSVLC